MVLPRPPERFSPQTSYPRNLPVISPNHLALHPPPKQKLEPCPAFRRAPQIMHYALLIPHCPSPQPSHLRTQPVTKSLPSCPYLTAKTKVRATTSPLAVSSQFLIPNCPPPLAKPHRNQLATHSLPSRPCHTAATKVRAITSPSATRLNYALRIPNSELILSPNS